MRSCTLLYLVKECTSPDMRVFDEELHLLFGECALGFVGVGSRCTYLPGSSRWVAASARVRTVRMATYLLGREALVRLAEAAHEVRLLSLAFPSRLLLTTPFLFSASVSLVSRARGSSNWTNLGLKGQLVRQLPARG